MRRHLAMARAGVCPFCACEVDVRVDSAGGDPNTHVSHPVRYRCDDCGAALSATLGMHLLDHPAVVAFLHDHGVSPDDRPYWTFPFCVDDAAATVTGTDPLRVEFPVTMDGDELRLTVDGAGEVRETIRVERRS